MNQLNRYDSIIEKIKITIDTNKAYDIEANQIKKKREELDKQEKALETKRKRTYSEKEVLLKELLHNENEVRYKNKILKFLNKTISD